MTYQIFSDSSCDLNEEEAALNSINVVPFYISIDGKTYKKEIVEIGVHKFYESMVEHPNTFPITSTPSSADYINAWTPYIEKGIGILNICITAKFSGSYNAALNAKNMLLEDYPDAKIEVVDSIVDTVLQGLVALEASKLQREGKSLEENAEILNNIRSSGRIIFTCGSMDYLIHGGRVGKVLKLVVGALKIRPMIILQDGEIFPFGMARSRKSSQEKIIKKAESYFKESGENPADYEFVIGYGYDYHEALEFKEKVLESMHGYSNINNIPVRQIGAAIGVHTGPYPLGLAFVKKG